VRRAAELAMPHRQRRQPFDEPGFDESKLDESKPLQNIKNIEHSLQILKGKLSKMSKQENENTQ